MATNILNVKVATNEYLELSDVINLGYQTIDGVIIRAGDRILVKSQGSGSLSLQNGIYAPNASGVLQRTSDFALGSTQQSGQLVVVAEGESFADTGWVVATDTVNGNVTVGTDLLIFSRFSINGNLIGVDVPSSIILRSEKGYPLTITELDNNFKYLANGLTEKLNIVDFNPTAITDKINSITAAAASLDAWDLRGISPSVEVIENTQTVAIRNTDGSLTSDTFIGDLQGRADVATNADMAVLAGNVTGIVTIEHGGTGTNNATQARINLGVVGVDGANSMLGKLTLAPSTTAIASLNIAPGAQPSEPSNGDIWASGANIYYRLAGVNEAIAPLRSPAFVGAPTAPTADRSSNSTNVATTAYVWSHVNVFSQVIATKANIDSPTLTGEPRSTTPSVSDNSTRIATTAYVTSLLNGTLSNYYDKATIDIKLAGIGSNLEAKINAVNAKADNALAQAGIPVGSIVYMAANNIPVGYLKCDGSLVSKGAYARLFNAIGYTYGGSGDYFRLPDLRGEFIRGFDDGRGVDPNRVFGSSQRGSLVGGFDNDNVYGEFSVIPTGPQFNRSSDPLNAAIASQYGLTKAQYASVRLNDYSLDAAADWYSIVRPRNVAMIACIKAFAMTSEDADRINATAVLDSINNKVSKLGDSMSGFLTLNANPVNAMHAATKNYVDQLRADIAGSYQSNSDANSKVNRSGDTMTGALSVLYPSSSNHAANKQYVDDKSADAINSALALAKIYANGSDGSGYHIFPGGLVIAWGRVTIPTSTGTRWNFPITIRNVLTVMATKTSTLDSEIISTFDWNTTSVGIDNWPGQRTSYANMLVIGFQ